MKKAAKTHRVCTENNRHRLEAVAVTAFAHFPLEQDGSNADVPHSRSPRLTSVNLSYELPGLSGNSGGTTGMYDPRPEINRDGVFFVDFLQIENNITTKRKDYKHHDGRNGKRHPRRD
ncbi:MAG: hypothetical protein E7604_14125 [Ruminococcaceae bacterium]|nr:hypothetical protein [Oscillospiraceae bacterium]